MSISARGENGISLSISFGEEYNEGGVVITCSKFCCGLFVCLCEVCLVISCRNWNFAFVITSPMFLRVTFC